MLICLQIGRLKMLPILDKFENYLAIPYRAIFTRTSIHITPRARFIV
jgi:hypothetical protein